MGINLIILLFISVSDFSFANSNESILRQELNSIPALFAIKEDIIAFSQAIKDPSYKIRKDFKHTNSVENDFEVVEFFEAEKKGFQLYLDIPSKLGGECGYLSHLHVVEKNSKQHLATLLLKDDCTAIGLSYFKNNWIHHVDLYNGSKELVNPNPNIESNVAPVFFPEETFIEDALAKTEEVRVCIIDNGFHLSHPGLQHRMARDEKGNILSLDVTDNDTNPFTDSPHGSHVAGIASKNSQKIKIVGVKITTNDNLRLGNTWRTDVEIRDNVLKEIKQALAYCAKQKANIVNLSLVYGELSKSESTNAEKYKMQLWKSEYLKILDSYPEHLYVVAAGNRALPLEESTAFPAGIQLPNLITVGAYDSYSNDLWLEEEGRGSNYSSIFVDVAAPGVLVYSFSINGDFDSFSGTSMASPFIVNVAARIKLQEPYLSSSQLKERVLSKAAFHPELEEKIKNGLVFSPELINTESTAGL